MASSAVCLKYQYAGRVGCSRHILELSRIINTKWQFWVVPLLYSVVKVKRSILCLWFHASQYIL